MIAARSKQNDVGCGYGYLDGGALNDSGNGYGGGVINSGSASDSGGDGWGTSRNGFGDGFDNPAPSLTAEPPTK